MALTDVVRNPPTSPRPPETPPGSPPCTPLNSPRVHESPRAENIDRFEQAVAKLIHALERVNGTNRREDAIPKATEHVKAGKPRIRASKLEYKLIDEMCVGSYIARILLTLSVQLG